MIPEHALAAIVIFRSVPERCSGLVSFHSARFPSVIPNARVFTSEHLL
jgi:hypothetical protein